MWKYIINLNPYTLHSAAHPIVENVPNWLMSAKTLKVQQSQCDVPHQVTLRGCVVAVPLPAPQGCEGGEILVGDKGGPGRQRDNHYRSLGISHGFYLKIIC